MAKRKKRKAPAFLKDGSQLQSWSTLVVVEAMNTPLKPPMMNIPTKATAFSMAEVKRICPPHNVPSQLKTFTADGKAIIVVEIMNVMPR